MNIEKANKALYNLIDNWIKDEEIRYLENLDDLLQLEKYKYCKYHIDLYNDKIELDSIPTNRLATGFNYTDLRVLMDFIKERSHYEN